MGYSFFADHGGIWAVSYQIGYQLYLHLICPNFSH